MPTYVDMRKKICLVTGATAGIGLATARALAGLGAVVIGVGRQPDKCTLIARQIRDEANNPNIEYLPADLSAQAEVRALAQEFRARYDQLDVLIHNVGGIFFQRQTTVDGLEQTLALNHLSHFLLTHELLSLLKTSGRPSAPARVVVVSSNAHYQAKINFDDLQNRHRYFGFTAYNQSKLCNVLFAHELARRLKKAPVTVNALHPGVVATDFGRASGWLGRAWYEAARLLASPPEVGARTPVYLAAAAEVEGVSGKYFNHHQREVAPSKASQNAADALRLWLASEQLTGLVQA